MRVDFYQLSRDPAPLAVAQIAAKAVEAGKRLLIVADEDALLIKVSEALWGRPGTFLANGAAGGPHDARQPILLSDKVDAANGATCLILADGKWREGVAPDCGGAECGEFERIFLFFDDTTVVAARDLWKALGNREDLTRNFWKQDGGKWVQAA
ncbi:MAG: DNA polymerase III subunit chi [Novosphingobium sp.]